MHHQVQCQPTFCWFIFSLFNFFFAMRFFLFLHPICAIMTRLTLSFTASAVALSATVLETTTATDDVALSRATQPEHTAKVPPLSIVPVHSSSQTVLETVQPSKATSSKTAVSATISSAAPSLRATVQLPTPPRAAQKPVTMEHLGDKRVDKYFWLREKTNPEVLEHLKAENAYTEQVMSDTKSLQTKLFREMKRRIKEEDQSAPERSHGYVYYSRTEAKKQYPLLCRRKGGMTGVEEVTLDLNALAKGKKFLRLGAYQVSPNGRLLAYALDYDGSRRYKLFIKDLKTGSILEQGGVIGGMIVWANDNKTLLYNVYDDALRSYKIMRHSLGAPYSRDEEVFREQDEKFSVSITKSRSDEWFIITCSSSTTDEVWLLNANKPTSAPTVVEQRRAGHEYSVEHQGNRLLILSNDNAVNFRLMEAPVSTPSQRYWKELLPHRPSVKLEDVDAFEHYVVLTERDSGLLKFRILDNALPSEQWQREPHYIAFPQESYVAYLGSNSDYNTTILRYGYESLVVPESAFDYDMATRKQMLVKQQEIPGGYNPDNYVSERLYATAADGARIPISIVYKKGLQRDGAHPMLLTGYGSYGIPNDPDFRVSRLSLLDRGFVFGIAHIRGGGDIGEEWYLNGKMLKKKNTFTDFITCAEFLVAEKLTSPERLAIEGRSAGGLLMGAVTNMRPDLFKAVHMGVPFVDVINTMLDATLPLTVGEYEEWGNPNDKVYYDYMKSYAPYENIERKAYPNILLTTGLNDTQVPYWEPAKHAAKLRELKTDTNVVLMKIDMGVGHGGASGRYDALKERAFEMAFFLKMLGVAE